MSTEHLLAGFAMLGILLVIIVLSRHTNKHVQGEAREQVERELDLLRPRDEGTFRPAALWLQKVADGYKYHRAQDIIYPGMDREQLREAGCSEEEIRHFLDQFPSPQAGRTPGTTAYDSTDHDTKLEEAKVLSAPETLNLRDKINEAVRYHLAHGGAARTLAVSSIDGYHWELVIRDRQVEPLRQEPGSGGIRLKNFQNVLDATPSETKKVVEDWMDEQDEGHAYNSGGIGQHEVNPTGTRNNTAYINHLISIWTSNGTMLSAEGVSDGYHTFKELYDMRLALTIAAMKPRARYARPKSTDIDSEWEYGYNAWRSRQHSDGTMFDGMFIVGLSTKPGRMITFHYHDEHWDKFDFCETLDKAPEWDGHTDKDVIERLLAL